MKDTYKLYIGIDPGKSGGVAMINKKDNALTVMKFPNELGELSVMIEAFIHNVKVDDVCVYIEHVHSFPTDSRPSAFSFGRNLGHWEGILSTHELKINTVTPRKWQSYYEVPKITDKYKRKRWLKEKAISLFPNTKVTLNTCDALLIVNYAKEMQYYKKKEKKGRKNK